jgi:hypothetical protein
MVTTCFGQYGHHQVLKCVVGKLSLFIMLLLHGWFLRCAHVSVPFVKISTRIFVHKALYITWLHTKFLVEIFTNGRDTCVHLRDHTCSSSIIKAAVSPLDITPDDGHFGQNMCCPLKI